MNELPRDNVVRVGLTIDEKLLVLQAVRAAGVTPHEWCRRALLDAARKETEDTQLEERHGE